MIFYSKLKAFKFANFLNYYKILNYLNMKNYLKVIKKFRLNLGLDLFFELSLAYNKRHF